MESVLGATPHEFESRILRQCLTGHDVEGPHRSRWGPSALWGGTGLRTPRAPPAGVALRAAFWTPRHRAAGQRAASPRMPCAQRVDPPLTTPGPSRVLLDVPAPRSGSGPPPPCRTASGRNARAPLPPAGGGLTRDRHGQPCRSRVRGAQNSSPDRGERSRKTRSCCRCDKKAPIPSALSVRITDNRSGYAQAGNDFDYRDTVHRGRGSSDGRFME